MQLIIKTNNLDNVKKYQMTKPKYRKQYISDFILKYLNHNSTIDYINNIVSKKRQLININEDVRKEIEKISESAPIASVIQYIFDTFNLD